jgi:ribonucleotide monophosphatase NagD (HAD superfamily)
LRPWSTQWQDRDGSRETRARLHRSGLGGLGLEAKDVAMVGDYAESAVAGAQRAGLRGVQVKTGKYRLGAVGEADGEIESIADLPAVLGL